MSRSRLQKTWVPHALTTGGLSLMCCQTVSGKCQPITCRVGGNPTMLYGDCILCKVCLNECSFLQINGNPLYIYAVRSVYLQSMKPCLVLGPASVLLFTKGLGATVSRHSITVNLNINLHQELSEVRM